MCSRLEYASSRFHAIGRHRNGTAIASDASPNAMKVACATPPCNAGPRVSSTRQATRITVGSSAAESSALTGGGASLWASGSQLWTGAQPIFAARPPMISRNAKQRAIPGKRVSVAGDLAPVERPEHAAVRRQADVQHEDPDERDRQPEGRQHEVLPARLERRAPPAVGDQQRRGASRDLDQQPGDAEVVQQRHDEQGSPEQMESEVVPGAGTMRAKEAAPGACEISRRHQRAQQPDDRDDSEEYARGAVEHIPRPMGRTRAAGKRDDRKRDRSGGDHNRPGDVDAISCAWGACELHEQAAQDRERRDCDRERVNHAGHPAVRYRRSRAPRGSSR